MASIIWLDLEDNRHESSKFKDIESMRFYICKTRSVLKVVELLDCDKLDNLYDESTYSGLFENCRNLTNVESVINTSDVICIARMFYDCGDLKEVPYFDTSQVSNMSGMFRGCGKLKNVPHFNTSNVLLMNSMFDRCTSLENVPLFNTSNVVSMNSMFKFCSNLKDVPHFDTLKVKSIGCMFESCTNLKYVPFLSVLKINHVDTIRSVFFRSEKFSEYLNKMGGSDNPRISEVFNIIDKVRVNKVDDSPY